MSRFVSFSRLFFVLTSLLFATQTAWAQKKELIFILTDSATQAPVAQVAVGVPGTSIAAYSNAKGEAKIYPLPKVGATLLISSIGYKQMIYTYLGTDDGPIKILLHTTDEEFEEVIITSTRTNSRIEDLPTKVEVLGEEEMKEENGIKPGNIASLLGDIAGTQIQPTSPTTGNADLRIQGLQGRYSQILRDGMPVLGGYAGGFGLLQIPPLDLRQAELIKGSNSTLFGGGSVAGLVNLISKTPTWGRQEVSATANQTTLQESNLNAFASNRGKKVGYTFFAGTTRQQFVDVNKDGFADVPDATNIVVHPRFFVYPTLQGREGQLALGYTGTIDKRKSGDVDALNGIGDGYTVNNRMARHTFDLIYTQPLRSGTLTAKGVVSTFTREVTTPTTSYTANQLSHYSEVSYLLPMGKHGLVFGGNFNGEALRPTTGGLTPLQNSYGFTTLGAFLQDAWAISPKTTLETGLRLDNHNRYGALLLPRLALLHKITPQLTARLNGGLGYRAVTAYVNETDERDLPRIAALTTHAERSVGATGDITWKHPIGEEGTLTLSQGFFYTRLANPAILVGPGQEAGGTDPLYWQNQSKPLLSRGLESYVRYQEEGTELYLGYQFNYAQRLYDDVNPNVELAARHKVATVFVMELTHHFGFGIEAAYTGPQYLSDGRKTPGYPFIAGMLRYKYKDFTLVLNGENLLDYRQTRKESVVFSPKTNPSFAQLWAPVEGRVINLSITYRLIKRK